MNSEIEKLSRGFIFNDVEPDFLEDELNLGFGWNLRKATPEEISHKQVLFSLQSYAQLRGHRHGYPPVLQDVKKISKTHTYNAPPKTLDELREVARLSVVESNGNPEINHHYLKLALAISDAELRIGTFFDSDYNGNISSWWEFSGFRINSSRMIDGELHLDRPSKQNIPDILETVSHMAKEPFQEVMNSIDLFMSLDQFPDETPMKHLGYFTVIESLLSHAPTPNDRADSIMRQLQRNLVLIDHRLQEVGKSLGFNNFGDQSPKNILKNLYSYRSCIAHGSDLREALVKIERTVQDWDVWGKDYGTFVWVGHWLRRLARRVLFAAIREPQLIVDLK